VAGAGDNLSEIEAEKLLQRMKNLSEERAKKKNIPLNEALKEIAGELKAEEETMTLIYKRNSLLNISTRRNMKNFAKSAISQINGTMGEGLRAFLQGTSKLLQGGRKSVDAQSKAINGQYFGRLVAGLEKEDLLRDFIRADEAMVKDIFLEMGAQHPGMPAKQVTQNPKAFKIAQIVDNLTAELIARENRAGAYITRLPGYIIRQTHDQAAIRALGRLGNNRLSKDESYRVWKEFVMPLLDAEKTFKGADPELVLRNMHEGLYSGIHGPATDEATTLGVTVRGSLAGKASRERLIHFKDAEAAYKYNQALGVKNFKEAVIQDIHQRSRNIALMENLGPNPEANLDLAIRELQEEARTRDDAAVQKDSLDSWRIKAAYNEISGKNEVSSNPSLSNMMSTAKVVLQLSKMGAVTLSSLSDRAFMHTEMAYQGMSNLSTFVDSLLWMAKKSPDEKRLLRMMGVAMDGLLGNSLSRYASHSSTSGWSHELQKNFFNLNGLNLWTDANKGAMGLLMANHLGENSHLKFTELPAELSKVLSQYDITPSRWETLRSHVVELEGNKFLTPEDLRTIPEEKIRALLSERDVRPTAANIMRERDALETALRTYYQDRIDIAVPTPGAAERKYATWNTKAGEPLGEAVRLLMMFKSFPITVMNKVVGRSVYGNGANSIGQWMLHDHKGKLNLAALIAMTTMAGYVSGALRDALKGRTPKPLVKDGKVNMVAVNDAAIRGGALGILGDALFMEYDHQYRSFLEQAAGPAFGQLNTAFAMKSQMQQGKPWMDSAAKLSLDNTPFINLFYTRPILDYFVLWNLQEMASPGSLRRMESSVERRTGQGFFVRPSETVK
jgi:hypothetical protein